MDPFLAEIRMFAGPFVPRSWRLCDGTLLPVRDYKDLFELIGTRYGGDGVHHFALPDLRGRTVVGSERTQHPMGESFGNEFVNLTMTDMPAHTHKVTVTPGTDGGGLATLYGVNNDGGNRTPEGNFPGQDPNAIISPYYVVPAVAPVTPVAMHVDSIEVKDLEVPKPRVTFGVAGAGHSHPNMMPSLVLNYIICVQGIKPSKS